MKPNTNYVDSAKVLAVVAEKGNSTKEQAGFYRVESKTAPNCRLYVARTKRVGRIDLSGFTVAADLGVIDLGPNAFGNVKQQVDFAVDEASLLANLGKILDVLNALPPDAAPKRSSSRKSDKPAAEASSPKADAPQAPVTPAEKRRAEIMARAQHIMAVENLTVAEALVKAQAEWAANNAPAPAPTSIPTPVAEEAAPVAEEAAAQ